MAKLIMDINIEQGYPYDFVLDMNTTDGEDLENDYTCYFECKSMGKIVFPVVDDKYFVTIPKEKTTLLTKSLEDYVVYVVNNTTDEYSKLLSGRIHTDRKVRT
jgi:hypothetical protein